MSDNYNTKENNCLHNNIFYRKLLDMDGEPHYTVQCTDCLEYGTILLVETENVFGLTKKDIDKIEL